jgi:hypothetical protein
LSEKFLGILEDGPFPGSYEFPKEIDEWPLPNFVKAKGYAVGAYVKTWESAGSPKSSKEARGAKYKWDATSLGLDLSE